MYFGLAKTTIMEFLEKVVNMENSYVLKKKTIRDVREEFEFASASQSRKILTNVMLIAQKHVFNEHV